MEQTSDQPRFEIVKVRWTLIVVKIVEARALTDFTHVKTVPHIGRHTGGVDRRKYAFEAGQVVKMYLPFWEHAKLGERLTVSAVLNRSNPDYRTLSRWHMRSGYEDDPDQSRR